MADRYWVGGTGNWSDTARWSATSGGAGGAGVPTGADNAYFDGNSDAGAAFTVSLDPSVVTIQDIIVGDGVTVTALDRTMTLAGTAAQFRIYGSLFYPATNFNRTFNGTHQFVATSAGKVVTTNGQTLNNIAFGGVLPGGGVGGVWTLGSALNIVGDNLTLAEGTLNTGNFNVNVPKFIMSGGTFNGGSSTISVVAGEFRHTGGVFNAGTSVIGLGNSGGGTGTFAGNGQTYYELVINQNSAYGDGTATISGANTFFNLRVASFTDLAACRTLFFGANQTITGTLFLKSATTSFTDRLLVSSANLGVARTITAAAVDFGNGVDFADITAAGASAPWNMTGKSSASGGNNTGITNFSTPKTVYWNLAGTQSWFANAWATTPTGTPAAANFPLLHDTAVFTDSGAAGTVQFPASSSPMVGTLTFDDGVSPRTSTVIISSLTNRLFRIFRDLKLSSGVSFVTSSGMNYTFFGNNTGNLTSAGRTFIDNVFVAKTPGVSLVLQDNFSQTGTNRAFSHGIGTLDLNNKVLSTPMFNSNNSNVRSIAFGTSGKIDLPANNTQVFIMSSAVNFTFTGTSNVELSYAGATGTRTIDFGTSNPGGATEDNVLNFTITAGFDRIVTRNVNFQGNVRNLIFADGFSGIFGLANNNEQRNAPICYGNVRFSPSMTFDMDGAAASLNLAATTGTQQLTTSGKVFPRPYSKTGAGTLRLMDNLTAVGFGHSAGTVDLNGKVLSVPAYSVSGTATRSLLFGAGELVLNGTGTVWDAATATNLTLVPGTGKIFITDTGGSSKTFAGGGIQTYPEVVIQGGSSASTISLTGANRFEKITNARTSAYTIIFPNETTTFNSWGLNGTEGNLLTLARTGGSGGFIISWAPGSTLIAQFVSLSNSTFLPSNRGYAIKSFNGGGNFGWIFGAPPFGKFLQFFSLD